MDHVGDAKVPLLVLHPEDDLIVKVEQARMLAEAAEDNDMVRVWILPAGAHGILEARSTGLTSSTGPSSSAGRPTPSARPAGPGRAPRWFTPAEPG